MSADPELIERLRNRLGDDHERGCAGRNYICSCGYNEANDALLSLAANRIEALSRVSTPPVQEGIQGVTASCTNLGGEEPDGSFASDGLRKSEWRPEVVAFADLMEAKLRENDHKGGWKGEEPWPLWLRMREESHELETLLGPGTRADFAAWSANVGREAADVANFAMMIADVCGALSPHPPSGVATVKPCKSEEARYAALGRACEANGLAGYGVDIFHGGEAMWFQPPGDLIAERAVAPFVEALRPFADEAMEWAESACQSEEGA